jgi:hypothetical protein
LTRLFQHFYHPPATGKELIEGDDSHEDQLRTRIALRVERIVTVVHLAELADDSERWNLRRAMKLLWRLASD